VQTTHHSIKLEWDNIRLQDAQRPEQQRLFDESGATRPGSLIYLHRRETRSGSLWENVYTYVHLIDFQSKILAVFTLSGSALFSTVDHLKSNTNYEFRIQYKTNSNGGERSDWSPILQARTMPEPMSSETMFRAIAAPGSDQLQKLLETL
jgi:hypothetical protein